MKIGLDTVKRRLVVTLLIFLLYMGMGLAMSPELRQFYGRGEWTWGELVLDLAGTFLFCLLFVEISIFYSWLVMRRLLPEKIRHARYMANAVLLFAMNNVTALVLSWVSKHLFGDPPQLFLINLYALSILAAFITSVYANALFLDACLEAHEEKKRLESIALQTQLRALKQQLDPHFMFNNFSILSELIHENPGQASRFLEALSKVYRYALRNFERDMVPVQEEMRFLDSYLYLLEIRYEDALSLEIDPALRTCGGRIPPASLQLLVENAIRHNRASREEPLHIRISLGQGCITVSNTLQPLACPASSTGTGLHNIIGRYSLLCNQAPVIQPEGAAFTVSLPLLSRHGHSDS